MTIFLTWQLRETLDNISVAELLSPFWFQICGKYNDIKSNPRDLWPETWLLRHWLFFWQLRTTILTITLWPLKKEWWWQHSQFLRCLKIVLVSQGFCFGVFKFDKVFVEYVHIAAHAEVTVWHGADLQHGVTRPMGAGHCNNCTSNPINCDPKNTQIVLI